MSNTFGSLFRITTFGESHGEGIGVVVDGCPAGVRLDFGYIQSCLDRRKPGSSRISTQRKEPDEFVLYSGHLNQVTTGAPLGFFVPNTNARSADYDHLAGAFRPSHADYTYQMKYGLRDHRGGGRSSARETIGRVIGGAVAMLYLRQISSIQVDAWVSQIHALTYAGSLDTWPENDAFVAATRCPDPDMARRMYDRIDSMRKAGDSVGGIITCRIQGCPPGLGEPIYNKLSAALGAAMLGINAVKGFEIGSGFEGASWTGSAHNDLFYTSGNAVHTQTNHSGGIQGGISNGEEIVFRVAFKPTATIMRPQSSVNAAGEPEIVEGKGRHDPCVVPRAVPIVEAMAALVLADMWLLGQARPASMPVQPSETLPTTDSPA